MFFFLCVVQTLPREVHNAQAAAPSTSKPRIRFMFADSRAPNTELRSLGLTADVSRRRCRQLGQHVRPSGWSNGSVCRVACTQSVLGKQKMMRQAPATVQDRKHSSFVNYTPTNQHPSLFHPSACSFLIFLFDIPSISPLLTPLT